MLNNNSEDIKEMADKLKILKKEKPDKFYEFKGRLDALYELRKEQINK